jgi:hypothetical protein
VPPTIYIPLLRPERKPKTVNQTPIPPVRRLAAGGNVRPFAGGRGFSLRPRSGQSAGA